ncbi:hypothetical protein NBRC116584_36980 [Hydrogenophaga sp. 5NK40-0174]
MHDATGEVVLAALLDRVAAENPCRPNIKAVLKEVDDALSSGWVSGILSNFEEFVEQDPWVKCSILDLTARLLLDSNGTRESEVVRSGGYQVDKQMFCEELSALRDLLSGKGRFDGPSKIYSLTERSWKVA